MIMWSPTMPNPRHPFPALRNEFQPRGWCVFGTRSPSQRLTAHAVLCASLPVRCTKRYGFTEHVAGTPDTIRARLAARADALEAHAKTCAPCAHALRLAVRHARL